MACALVQEVKVCSSGWSIPTACAHSTATAGSAPPTPILSWAGLVVAAKQIAASTKPRRAEIRLLLSADSPETEGSACSCLRKTGKVSLGGKK